MLIIDIPMAELFDEKTNMFVETEPVTLEFEHSLVSLSKWEAKYQKPFLGNTQKENEEVFAYLKFMLLTEGVDESIFLNLSKDNISAITSYIDSKESATTFHEVTKGRNNGEVITSELIYYWMVALNIPFECQYWHLNRLFALIRICGIKNSPPKKMGAAERAARNRQLNAERKAKYNTRG